MEHLLGADEAGAACPCGSGLSLFECCGSPRRSPAKVVEERTGPDEWVDPDAERTGERVERPRLLEEGRARVIALANHPAIAEALRMGSLPDEAMGPACGPFSWLMHLQLHVIVEIQLGAGDPPGIWQIERRLRALGLGPHALRHALMQVLFERVEAMRDEETEFDLGLFLKDLDRMARERELPA